MPSDHVETVTDTVAVAPIKYTGQALIQQDIDNFKAALKKVKVVEGFLPVAAPASVIPDRKNEYYKSDEDLAEAIGQAMHVEYKQIVDNGLLAQLDDARAAVTYDRMVPPASFQDYRKRVRLYQDVLNRATEGIPTEKIRYHVCWGSWPGPHTTDVPIKDIMDLILRVRAGAYVLEMANPRHEHEWQVWQDVKLPKGSVLIPGVISHATNVVEHPELVKERIVRLAKLVGRENVIAGTDCGFAQQPFYQRVHPTHSVGEAAGAGRGRAARQQGIVGQGQEERGEEEGRAEEAGGEGGRARGLTTLRSLILRSIAKRVRLEGWADIRILRSSFETRLRHAPQDEVRFASLPNPSPARAFSSHSRITLAMSSEFFSSIIMWPLPWMPTSPSRIMVLRTPACVS